MTNPYEDLSAPPNRDLPRPIEAANRGDGSPLTLGDPAAIGSVRKCCSSIRPGSHSSSGTTPLIPVWSTGMATAPGSCSSAPISALCGTSSRKFSGKQRRPSRFTAKKAIALCRDRARAAGVRPPANTMNPYPMIAFMSRMPPSFTRPGVKHSTSSIKQWGKPPSRCWAADWGTASASSWPRGSPRDYSGAHLSPFPCYAPGTFHLDALLLLVGPDATGQIATSEISNVSPSSSPCRRFPAARPFSSRSRSVSYRL